MKIVIHYKKLFELLPKFFKYSGILLFSSIISIFYICITMLLGAYLLGNHISLTPPHAFIQLIDLAADWLTGIIVEVSAVAFIFLIYFIFQCLVELLEDSGVIEIKR